MSSAPDTFVFLQVSSSIAEKAFAFHQSISSSNEHIWPRTEEEVRRFAEEGELFGIRRGSLGGFVGLCYVTLEKNEWEVGGLIVAKEVQSLGLGTVLVSFALAHTIANQRPWFYAEEVIAYVHEANEEPRKLLKSVGFEQTGSMEVPDEKAPPSMKRNAQGKVVGDKFRFPPNRVDQLSVWFEDFTGTLRDGKTQAIFEIPPAGLDSLREALKEAVKDLTQ